MLLDEKEKYMLLDTSTICLANEFSKSCLCWKYFNTVLTISNFHTPCMCYL